MTIKEIRDRRNKLLHDAQAILLADQVTPENRASATAMLADADVLEQDIANLERIEAENRSANPVPRGQIENRENPEVDVKAEARNRLLAFMRTGTPLSEKRDLTSASNSGGYFIPQAFDNTLYEAQKSWGGILNVVGTKVTDNGAPMKVGISNDVTNSVTVIGENTTVSEVDPVLSGTVLSTSEITTGVVKVSLAELQDSAFDIDQWLKNEFGKRFFRGVSALVTVGATNVTALTTANSGATSKSGTAISYADIAALYGSLDPAYLQNATWAMNSTTRAYLLDVTDTLGRPLFVPSPNAGAFDHLLGRPVVLNQSLANIAVNAVAVQLGDFSQGYLYRSVKPGLSIVRLNERYMDELAVGFLGAARIGGALIDPGTHPIQSLTQAAS